MIKVYVSTCIPERCDKRKALHTVAAHWTGIGMVAACCARTLLVRWPRLQPAEVSFRSRFLQLRLPWVRTMYNTRNQFGLKLENCMVLPWRETETFYQVCRARS